MAIGLVGRKAGMTRIFTEDGVSIPVTVVSIPPNRVTQVKLADDHGYNAVQVTVAIGERKSSKIPKSEAGHFVKAGVSAGKGLWEFRLSSEDEIPELGAEIGLDAFSPGQKVDVSGLSKGKGFQGVVKRWNFKTQDATHGNSLSHRAPGSIGQCQTPGRVFKGKKMSGQMGGVKTTVQSLEVVRVDTERNVMLVKGGVPGSPGTDLIINRAVKTDK
jgi:large subunit ribosomal protein L3